MALMTGRETRLSLIPPISRAREYRLYPARGARLLDLWQYGGRAVLGHNPAGVLREFKNTAERGLFAPFPAPVGGRFIKALSVLFPGRVFRVYSGTDTLRRALAGAGFPADAPFPDPLRTPPEADGRVPAALPPLWRPFAGLPVPDIFVPVLPLPWAGAPPVLALTPEGEARLFGAAEPFPEGPLSPALLAAALRAVYDLIAAPARKAGAFPKIRRVLAAGNGRGSWRSTGIYLSRGKPVDEAAWTALFRRFLEAGVLIPPERGEPLILPGVLSAGEEAKIAALLTGGEDAGA
jgi:hypothetical protein